MQLSNKYEPQLFYTISFLCWLFNSLFQLCFNQNYKLKEISDTLLNNKNSVLGTS